MKRILLVGLCTFFYMAGPSANEPADTVYINGKIYTVDGQRSWAQALAVSDGRYQYIGNNDGIKKYMGPTTQVVNLNSAFVSPSSHDLHIHALSGELGDMYACKLESTSSVEDIVEAVATCVRENPEEAWILGDGWLPDLMEDHKGRPVRELLDEVSGDKAVYVSDMSGHHAMVNSRALELSKLTAEAPVAKGGTIHKDASGKMNGFLSESPVLEVGKAIPPRAIEEQQKALAKLLQRMHRAGLTGWKEAYVGPETLQVYSLADAAGELTAHVAAAQSIEDEADIEALIERRKQYGGRHFSANYAKVSLDGVPITRTAYMLQPYVADEEHGADWRGEPTMTLEKLTGLMQRLDSEGFMVKMHASGDASTRMVLGAVETVRRENDNSGIRHEIAHATYIHPDDFPRFKALNVAAEMSPMFWYTSIMLQMVVPSTLGEQGFKMFPIKSLLDAQAPVIPGTDWTVVEDMNPLLGLEAMVTRSNPEPGVLNWLVNWWWGPVWEEQKVDLATAIEIYTIDSAAALDLEQETGSIEVGKSADFVVWDQNFFEIDNSEISEVHALKTVFAGETVYSAGEN